MVSDRRAGRDDLAGPRKLILDAPRSRRHERQIIDDRLDAIDLGLRVRDLGQGLIALRGEVFHRRDRGIEVALALLEGLLGDEAGLHQLLAALEVGFGEFERALPGRDFGLRGASASFAFCTSALAARNCGLVFGRGELRDNLALRDVEPSSTVTSARRPAYFEETSTWVASRRPFDLTMPSGSFGRAASATCP